MLKLIRLEWKKNNIGKYILGAVIVAAIVTSILLSFLTQANVGDFMLANNAVFPVVLTVISFGFAVMSLYNVENRDLV